MQSVDILEVADVQAMISAAVIPLQHDIDVLEERVRILENPVLSPSGFVMNPVFPTGWRLGVEEDFDLDVEEGQFGLYGDRGIGFYPGIGETSKAHYGTATGGATGYKDTSGRGMYSGKFIRTYDGVCYQRGFTDSAGKIWVSAIVPFSKLVSNTSKWGDMPAFVFEQCTRFPVCDPGFKWAHLAWPITNTNDPDGEIDWPEAELNNVKGYIHHQNPQVNGVQTVANPNPAIDARNWHVYRTEFWKGQRVRLLCDGVLIKELASTTLVPQKDMHIVLQNETSLLRDANGVRIPVPATSKYQVETDWLWLAHP